MDSKEKYQREQALHLRIVKVALQAFAKSGIKAVTMDEIASLLGISKRTLYEHFPDKENLVLACVKYHHQEHEAVMMKALSVYDNVIDIILSFYRYTVEDFYKVNPRFFQDMRRYPSIQKLMKERNQDYNESTIVFFERGVEEGLLRKDVNFKIAHELLNYQFNLLMESDIALKYSFFEVYESIFFTFLRGVSTEKGQLIIEQFIRDYRKNKK